MANELIINVTLGETLVARLENGVVTELFIERVHQGHLVGNIYKGKVVRVLPGMQAAFVDIGLERTAFVHAHDLISEDNMDDKGRKDLDDDIDPRKKKKTKVYSSIDKLLKEGNEILVQVEKEPIGTKGARITCHISLPGRYLVYMPSVKHYGASRRIEDAEERTRLKNIIKKCSKDHVGGFIARTVCEGASEAEIQADIEYLTKLWAEIEVSATKVKSPSLVRSELGVLDRVARDHFTPDIDRVVLDSEVALNTIEAFISQYMPDAKSALELYSGSEPVFDAFGIEIEITRALGQKVWLKSGGYVIIEQTEALTAIDVNTGRFVGKRDVEDTIVKTNLEAVKEIVYQLRLRDIGGIIILDFIDMQREANRQKVYHALKEALSQDKARTSVTKISELGLVEMTRKRTREDLRRQLTNPCTYCEGKGYLKSAATLCYEIFREIRREVDHIAGKQIVVICHPKVAQALYDDEREQLDDLEKRIGRRISISGMIDYHFEQFDVEGK
ncbi:MAG: Rne/Rng family ribonuclease [Deltaproteobacteria bacterium CG_4_10_14_0_2_um_filter_43_8]|nr:MAG: Rne/Rng family ribonuclease [Deltaproteobacteria bacterium CG_4_10_14_0_2_um_filter_43_8]